MPSPDSLVPLRKRLLVVDDERIVAEDIAECLEAMGCEVLGIAITGEQAIALAGEHRPDLVLMDICLQGHVDGVEAALAIRDRWQIPSVFLTAYSDSGVLQRAKQSGPLGYIVKPFDEAGLRTTVELALHRCDLDRALRDNREWFATILTSMQDGVIVADLHARIAFMNPAAERLTGWDSLRVAGQPVAHVCPLYHADTGHQQAHPVLAALAGDAGASDSPDLLLLRADRSLVAVDASGGVVRDRLGTVTGAILILRDVTEARRATQELRLHRQHLEALVTERTKRLTETNERLLAEIEDRKRAEASLARAQRMEAVGRLSGGIAHDFNNTLLPIIGYADLLLSRLPPDDTTTLELTEIRRAAQHAASLTRQLLSFSRKQVVNKVVMNLNDELATMGSLLQRIIGEDVTLETSLADDLPPILADPGQIQQVVMNLVVNAREAMPGGGRILLRTEVARGEPASPGDATGPQVRLTVQDTGRGIPEEIRDRIFDPFFSTKGHEGSGLGLSVIFSILDHHGGSIDFETEIERGTAFHILLPATSRPQTQSTTADDTASEALPVGQGQRILLIEDEVAVNRFVTTALSRHGYEVLSAETVDAAWTTFEREAGRFDMVFSDAILPDGNGVELISRVLGQCPEMRTLLSSGYLDKDALLRLARERDIYFLQKPYTLPDLLRTVDDVLHAKRETVLN